MPRKLKGMVLAAGLGTRLRPLTDLYPKPLVPFAGTTPLQLALWQLHLAGIDEVAVNSHYRPEMVAALAQTRPFGLNLQVSYEPVLLGTGGAYGPLREWLEGADLVVLNGDVVASFALAPLVAAHRTAEAAATMMLLPDVIPGESAVFHQAGRILAIGKTPPLTPHQAGNFACAQVLSPRFLAQLPTSGVFDIVSAGYQVALKQGWPLATLLHTGYWHDLRTPQFYWAALLEALQQPALCTESGIAALRQRQGLAPLPDAMGVLYDHRSSVAPSATIGPQVIIEPGVKVGAGARVSQAVLLPGAVVAPGSICERVIIGPSLRVALTQH